MRREQGSASIWVVAGVVIVLFIAMIAVVRTEAVLARHRAESAADLAALAAAGQIGVSGKICQAASRIAKANDATLRACNPDVAADGRSGTVVVRVEVRISLPIIGSRHASASARAGRLTAD